MSKNFENLSDKEKEELSRIADHVKKKYGATILSIVMRQYGIEGLEKFVDALSFVTLGYKIREAELKGELPNVD